MKHSQTLALIVAASALMAGCSTPIKQEEPKPAPVVEAPVAKKEEAPVVKPVVAPVVDEFAPGGKLANRSVYFDFDSYVVREDGKPVITNHSDYLSKNKDRKVLIQGNADERGGSEYNLALGQKRSEAVRKAMAANGVAESQMEAVSLGKTQPKNPGHDEAAWAENRRADIVYAGK